MPKSTWKPKCITEIDFTDSEVHFELQYHNLKSVDKNHEICTRCGIKTIGLGKYIEEHKIDFSTRAAALKKLKQIKSLLKK